MSNDQPLTTTVSHELRMRQLTVEDIAHPTPRLVRVTLGGEDMAGFRSDGAGDHVKVFFPAPGADRPELPALGPDGVKVPSDAPKPRGRDYTPKHQLLSEGKLMLDIVLHDSGVGSDWARTAALGDTLGIAGPRGSHVLAGEIDGLMLFGDETALPAIANFLDGADPAQTVRAFVEVADEQDIQSLSTRPNHTVTWLARDGATPGSSQVLVDAASAVEPLAGRVLCWIAAEASIANAVRHALVDQGVSPEAIESRGYWKCNTPDHQEPHED